MQPQPEDYTIISGKSIPHIGANRNRKLPTLTQLNFLTQNMWLFNNQIFNPIS